MVADKAVYLFEHTYLLDWDINMVYVANIHMLVCGATSYLLLSHFLRSLIGGGPRGYMAWMVVAWTDVLNVCRRFQRSSYSWVFLSVQ